MPLSPRLKSQVWFKCWRRIESPEVTCIVWPLTLFVQLSPMAQDEIRNPEPSLVSHKSAQKTDKPNNFWFLKRCIASLTHSYWKETNEGKSVHRHYFYPYQVAIIQQCKWQAVVFAFPSHILVRKWSTLARSKVDYSTCCENLVKNWKMMCNLFLLVDLNFNPTVISEQQCAIFNQQVCFLAVFIRKLIIHNPSHFLNAILKWSCDVIFSVGSLFVVGELLHSTFPEVNLIWPVWT